MSDDPRKALRVSQHKVDYAINALTINPSITGQQLADEMNCCLDSAYFAIKAARIHIQKQSQNIRERAEKLKQERAEKALDAAERQIRDRLDTLRSNAEQLQSAADMSGTIEEIQAANRAWKELTDYERKVTGIEQAERAQTASAGKAEVNLHLPLSPEAAAKIIPVK